MSEKQEKPPQTQLPPCPACKQPPDVLKSDFGWSVSCENEACGLIVATGADYGNREAAEAAWTAAASRGETHGQAAFWVLEQFKNEQGQGYWKGCCSQHWTKDIDEATQFCRKQDALSIWRHASLAYEGFEVRAVEHAYIPAQSTERCEGPCSPCGDGDTAMQFHTHDARPVSDAAAYTTLNLDNVEFQNLVNMLRDYRTEAKKIGGPSGAENALIEKVLKEESRLLSELTKG